MNSVLVSGLSRGGTNLIWTSLASRVNYFIPKLEVNQLFSTSQIGLKKKLLLESLALSEWYLSKPLNVEAQNVTYRYFSHLISSNIKDSVHDWLLLGQADKSIQEFNRLFELRQARFALKMVSSWSPGPMYSLLLRNNPLKYINLIANSGLNINKYIFVLRDPRAQIEAWGRRGCAFSQGVLHYKRYMSFYLAFSRAHPDITRVIKLQSFLSDPLACVNSLYNFLGCSQPFINSVRIAKRPTLSASGYINSSDKISSLYNSSSISAIIDSDIENKHISNANFSDYQIQKMSPLLKRYNLL